MHTKSINTSTITLFLLDRFWKKVNKNGPVPDGREPCWIWTAAKTKRGYGHFAIDQHQVFQAHRFAYALLIGPIQEGLTLDHLCRNPECVNPSHLEPVTLTDNIRRGSSPSAANRRLETCRLGHPFIVTVSADRPEGRRRCKICASARARERKFA